MDFPEHTTKAVITVTNFWQPMICFFFCVKDITTRGHFLGVCLAEHVSQWKTNGLDGRFLNLGNVSCFKPTKSKSSQYDDISNWEKKFGEHICPSSRDWWAAMKGGDLTSVVCV